MFNISIDFCFCSYYNLCVRRQDMNKAQRLSKDLEQRKLLRNKIIRNQEKVLKEFDDETNKLETRLEKVRIAQSASVQSTTMWCKLSNAIIRKYKPLSEKDPTKAYKELLRLEGVLLANGLFTQEELEKAIKL